MTGITQGILGHPNKELYIITTDDSQFARMGLTSFTLEALYDVIYRDKMLTIHADGSPSSTNDVFNTILGGGSIGIADNAPAIMYYDNTLKRHFHRPIGADPYNSILGGVWSTNRSAPATNVEALVEVNNDYVKESGFAAIWGLGAEEMIKDVKTSASGCVTWWLDKSQGYPLFVNTTPGAPPARSCVKPIEPRFRLFLYSASNEKGDKGVVGKGPPKFTAMPTTVAGKAYSFSDTDKGALGMNQFKPPREGGSDNPKNAVAGELAIHYNKNTGQFESGTKQMLARLLTNVPAVQINKLPNAATIDLQTDSEYSDPAGDYYTGWFNEGWALQMSVHNGNPNLFGPVWKNQQCKKDEKEKIKCINRSPTDFFKGDIVMLSFIDGEWILQEFRNTAEITPFFGVSNWGFVSYISNSDHFFRDARYYYEGITNRENAFMHYGLTGGLGPPEHSRILTHDDYEGYFHQHYFDDVETTAAHFFAADSGGGSLADITGGRLVDPGLLSAINLGYTTLDEKQNGRLVTILGVPVQVGKFERPDAQFADRGYWQYSSFDFLGKNFGGLCRHGNLLGRTNRYFGADGGSLGEDPDPSYVFHPFSGPIFAQGYKKSDGSNGALFGEMNFMQAMGVNAGQFYSTHTANNYAGKIDDISFDKNQYGGLFSYTGADDSLSAPKRFKISGGIGSAKTLPADIALNASSSGINGLPMDDLGAIKRQVSWYQHLKGLPAGMEFYFKRYGAKREFQTVTTGAASGSIEPIATRTGVSATAGSGSQIFRYTWLGNLGDNYDNDDIFDSYYDLKPVAINSVTFMPLSAETVASYDLGCHRPFPSPTGAGASGSHGPDVVKPYSNPRNFYERAANNFRIAHLLEDGSITPALVGGTGRGFLDNGAGGELAIENAMLPPEFLSRNRRISPINAWRTAPPAGPGSPAAAGPGGNPANLANAHSWWGSADELYIPSAGEVRPTSWSRAGIPYDWWTAMTAKNHYAPFGCDWYTATGDHPVADCVGVTTAKCTIGAGGSTSINFTCNQLIGVVQQANVTGGGADLSIFNWLFTGGAAGISADDPAVTKHAQWGTLSDNYYDFGTTALHVRLFEVWPHEQTLFDHRYFAVKHFNPGQRDSDVLAQPPNSPRRINTNSDCTNTGASSQDAIYCKTPTQAEPFDGKTGSYKHSYDKEDYSVDFRVPTYGPTPGDTNNPDGDFVHDDGIVAVGAVIGRNIALRPQGEWRINPVRRGMLLPFSYKMRTIGLHSKSDSFVFNMVADAQGTMKPHGGDGYQIGDTFVFYGGAGAVGSAKAKVKAVEANQVTGLAGAIKYPAFDPVTGAGVGLEWVLDENDVPMRGYGYAGTDFADLSVSASKDYGSIKLMAEEVNGKDFICYVRAGEVWDKTMTDAAPAEIGGVQRASLSSGNGRGTGTGRAIGTSRVGFAVDPGRGAYDAFLFFHNDIGHTIAHTSDIGQLNSEQQWITVDISAS